MNADPHGKKRRTNSSGENVASKSHYRKTIHPSQSDRDTDFPGVLFQKIARFDKQQQRFRCFGCGKTLQGKRRFFVNIIIKNGVERHSKLQAGPQIPRRMEGPVRTHVHGASSIFVLLIGYFRIDLIDASHTVSEWRLPFQGWNLHGLRCCWQQVLRKPR